MLFSSILCTVQYSAAPACTAMYPDIYKNKFFNVHSTYFVCSTLRVILQGFVDPIMQHGVRIEVVFVSLQQGEHMVESTAVSCILHTSRQVQ